MAYKCDSYGDYIYGKCYSCRDCGCQIAGLDLQIARGESSEHPAPVPDPLSAYRNFLHISALNRYVRMAAEPPYCLYTYRIKLVAEANPEFAQITMFMTATNGRTYSITMDLSVSSSFLFTHPSSHGFGGPFNNVRLQITDVPAALVGEPFVITIAHIEFSYMSHFAPKVRQKFSSKVCSKLFSDEYAYFGAPSVETLGVSPLNILFSADQCDKNDKIAAKTLKTHPVAILLDEFASKEKQKRLCDYNCRGGSFSEPIEEVFVDDNSRYVSDTCPKGDNSTFV